MAVVTTESAQYRGRGIDLRETDISGPTVADALYAQSNTLSISCPSPGKIHQRVGWVREEREYSIRTALAATARALGYTSEFDQEITQISRQLEQLKTDDISIEAIQKQQAQLESTARLEERIAELQGEIKARQASDRSADEQIQELQTIAAELSERKTRQTALQQRLDEQRQQLRKIRDQREERLKLQDRRENLRRQAREQLSRELQPTFKRALRSVPGEYELGDTPGTVQKGSTTAALAVCRIAPITGPIIVESNRFERPAAATAALQSSVILV